MHSNHPTKNEAEEHFNLGVPSLSTILPHTWMAQGGKENPSAQGEKGRAWMRVKEVVEDRGDVL